MTSVRSMVSRSSVVLAATALLATTAVATSPLTASATTGTPSPTGSIQATGSTTTVQPTASNQAVASVIVTLSSTGSLAATSTLQLNLTQSSVSGAVDWQTGYSISSTGVASGLRGASGSGLSIMLGSKANGTRATVTVSNIKVTTTQAQGPIDVSASLTHVTFSPSSAHVATVATPPSTTTTTTTTVPTSTTVPSTPTPGPTAVTLSATSSPTIGVGALGTAGGTWDLTLSGTSGTVEGWLAGAAVTITVTPPSGARCTGDGGVWFASTPAASVAKVVGVSEVPTVSVAKRSDGSCPADEPDVLVVTLEGAGTFDAGETGSVEIVLSGVRYAVGATAKKVGAGPLAVSASYSASSVGVDTTRASNATVSAVEIGADTPRVDVPAGMGAVRISPVQVTDSSASGLGAGYLCLSLVGATFDTSVPPSVTAATQLAGAGPSASYAEGQTVGASVLEVEIPVNDASVTSLAISGIAVDAGTTLGAIEVTATEGASPSCSQDLTVMGEATAFFVVATGSSRIAGPSADATAAAELTNQFDHVGTDCPGRTGTRPVVLVGDTGEADALVSVYLASTLGTGELLTQPDKLSSVTAAEIRAEGITTVYAVGDPASLSQHVVTALRRVTVHLCGGGAPRTGKRPTHLRVVRIAGTTAGDTAKWVAEYPPSSEVGTLNVSQAYSGTNAQGGTGAWNETAGLGSQAPATAGALPTAVLVSDAGAGNAAAASALSYAEKLPILMTSPRALSASASAAISALHVTQVIVVGGPSLVGDEVVTELEGLGVAVLRVAGVGTASTAVELAELELAPTVGHEGLGWTPTGSVVVACGDASADGYAGAIVAAGGGTSRTHGPEPLLVTESPSLPGRSLEAFLETAGHAGVDGNAAARIASITVLGGTDAVTPAALEEMQRLL